MNDLLIDNIPGAPPPEDTSKEEPIDPYQPVLTCTPDPTKAKANRQVVGLENAGGGKHITKQLDCETSVATTENNRIDGIYSGLHTNSAG